MYSFKPRYFYLFILALFAALMYWLIGEGTRLESGRMIPQVPSPAAGWSETFLVNFHHPFALLLVQIIVILSVARCFGWLFQKIRQPAVVGEIMAGVLLGPSLVGYYVPAFSSLVFPVESLGYLQVLSQLGLVLFMFIVGMELNLKIVKSKAQEALVISHASIVIPFFLGVLLAYFIYPSYAPASVGFLSFALFMGIAMSITAFPVLARIVQERGLHQTRLGTLVITCAAVDDVTAWCLLAAVIVVVKAGSWISLLWVIGLSAMFILLMLYGIHPLLVKMARRFAPDRPLARFSVASFFLVLLASAWLTEVIGIHALFGAFLTGVIMPDHEPFRRALAEKVEDVALVLLLPLFFVITGLRTQVGLLSEPSMWWVAGWIIGVAVAGKFLGSALAARVVGQSWKDSLSIGALMNTRGLMELIVLNIGYDLGILSPELFTMMVLMALLTTCMTGPALDLIERYFKSTPERAS